AEIRTEIREAENELPNIAGPRDSLGRLLSGRYLTRARQAIMQCYERSIGAETLEVHEIAQGELEQMPPVDECEVDRATKDLSEVVAGKELVAGQPVEVALPLDRMAA